MDIRRDTLQAAVLRNLGEPSLDALHGLAPVAEQRVALPTARTTHVNVHDEA